MRKIALILLPTVLTIALSVGSAKSQSRPGEDSLTTSDFIKTLKANEASIFNNTRSIDSVKQKLYYKTNSNSTVFINEQNKVRHFSADELKKVSTSKISSIVRYSDSEMQNKYYPYIITLK